MRVKWTGVQWGPRCAVLALLACGAPALAVQDKPDAPARPPSTSTVQEQFQAGAVALRDGDGKLALDIYAALETRVAKSPRSLAIVRLRKGQALVMLGRKGEAREALTAGLATLPGDDPSLREDRFNAETSMGLVERTDLNYAEALARYNKAGAIAEGPAERLVAMMGQIETGTFVDPQAMLPIADEAYALVNGLDSPAPADIARIRTARGRLFMNLGRFKEALAELDKAVSQLGGLTLKVDYNDLVSRSDAAIAAELAGNQDKALDYLVYTGAGRLPKQDFTNGVDMTLPPCGEAGISPEDVAVIELGIGENGEVSYARPVYASRPGEMGLVFAREVAKWSWQPEEVKDIPLLFRFVTRLELRCSSSSRPPGLRVMARASFIEWVQSVDGQPFAPVAEDDARRRAELEQELKRREESGAASRDLVPVLARLIVNSTTSPSEKKSAVNRLRSISLIPPLPILARLYLDLQSLPERQYGVRNSFLSALSRVAEPYRADPVAYAIARLTYYDELKPATKSANRALLDELANDERLAANPMLRTAILIRRAALRAKSGDFAGAQQDYAATGRNEQECSIVDARPQVRNYGHPPGEYPTEIVRRGVEGWTIVEFDVAADGRTLDQRAVITYPPFIFSNAGQRLIRATTFEQSYRPGGAVGCSGSMRSIMFRMP
jgi:tetratricopeptide (TPR) repeat protein